MTAYPNLRGHEADHSGDSTKARSSQARRLVALTKDPALTKALHEVASAEVGIDIVADMRALSDYLMQHTSAAAMIDATALDAPIDGAVDAITTQFPDLCLMVAGQANEQNLLATRISNQTVFRFVHKPASPQRLKLFLDAAARPAEARRSAGSTDSMLGSDEPLGKIETAVRGKSPQTLAIIGVVAILAIAGGAWALWPKGDPAAAAPAVAKPAAPAAKPTSPEVLALVGRADKAFAAGKYVDSDGSSAAELYRDALKLDAQNAVARSGFDRSVEFGLRAAEESLLTGKLTDATGLAESLRLITPNNSRLAFLNKQIEREVARVNADASQRAALEGRQTQIREALAQMTERMRRGALIEPSSNSAISHFRAAENLGPADTAVRNARETLVAALLTAADGELSARKAPAARRLIDAAATINSSAPGLDVLRRRVDEVTSQAAAASAEAAAQAARAAEAAANPAPAPASTTPAVVASAKDAAPAIVSANSLKALRVQPADYPPRALEQLVSGWVEMEFTVARDGSVQDVVVTNAEPKRTFDTAAVAAMKRYRYQPVMRNGEVVTQRARMRMRFTAQENK